MRILITGGSGFIGTNLVEFFLKKKYNVLNLDINEPRNFLHKKYWKNVNILNAKKLKLVFKLFKPDYVLHFAARTDLDGKSINDYSENIIGVRNIILAANSVNTIKRIIFASSRLVCNIGYTPKNAYDYCPPNFYGQSKVEGELIVQKYCCDSYFSWVILRPTSIWGPWFGIPYKNYFLAIYRGRYFHPGNMKIHKSFGFVGNTVFSIFKVLISKDDNVDKNTFYLADYKPLNLFTFSTRVSNEMNKRPIRKFPVFILKFIASLGDFLLFLGIKNVPLTSFRLNNIMTNMIFDMNELKIIVGKLPFSNIYGIKSTIKWLKTQKEIS